MNKLEAWILFKTSFVIVNTFKKSFFLVLFLFWKKKRLIKWAAGVCVCVCVCVSVQFWSPPNNFQTSYPINTKFWLHTVSYRNSPTPLIPVLNFESCAREKFLKFIFFSIKLTWGNFRTHITPLIYELDDWNSVCR